jgi:hypothetical protein
MLDASDFFLEAGDSGLQSLPKSDSRTDAGAGLGAWNDAVRHARKGAPPRNIALI